VWVGGFISEMREKPREENTEITEQNDENNKNRSFGPLLWKGNVRILIPKQQITSLSTTQQNSSLSLSTTQQNSSLSLSTTQTTTLKWVTVNVRLHSKAIEFLWSIGDKTIQCDETHFMFVRSFKYGNCALLYRPDRKNLVSPLNRQIRKGRAMIDYGREGNESHFEVKNHIKNNNFLLLNCEEFSEFWRYV
jgi:hypothetical protein